MCCDTAMNDTCTASGLCDHPDGDEAATHSYWRDACTDSTWASPACLSLCLCMITRSTRSLLLISIGSSSSSEVMTQCGDGSWCCGNENSTCCNANEGVKLLPIAGATTSTTTTTPTTTSAGMTTSTTTSISISVSTPTSGTTPTSAQTPTSVVSTTSSITTTLGSTSGVSGPSQVPQPPGNGTAATDAVQPAIVAVTTPTPSVKASSTSNALPIGIGVGLGLGLSVIATILGMFLWHKRQRPMSINATFVVSDEKYPFPHNESPSTVSPATDCAPDYPIPSYSAAMSNMQEYRGISYPIKGTSEAQYHNYLRSEKSGLNGLTVFELP